MMSLYKNDVILNNTYNISSCEKNGFSTITHAHLLRVFERNSAITFSWCIELQKLSHACWKPKAHQFLIALSTEPKFLIKTRKNK